MAILSAEERYAAEIDAAEEKRHKKAARRAAAAAAEAAAAEPEVDATEAKRLRKAAKRAAAEAAEAATAEPEVDASEAKRLRKEAKRAAAEAAAVTVEPEVDAAEAKKQRKAAKKAAAAVEAAAEAELADDVDAVEAKKLQKSAKRAAAEVASADASVDETPQKKVKQSNEDGPLKDGGSKGGGKGKDKGKDKVKGKGGEGKDKEFEVFVRGLPFSATQDVLWKDFSECGAIANFHMPLNDEGNARGIAFIEFSSQEAVEKALAFNDTEYGGRWIQVRLSSDDSKGKGKDGKNKGDKGKDGKSKGKGNKEFEVFIGGLPSTTTENVLRTDFEECGKIVYCRVPVNDDGTARGIAFVEFADSDAVEKALKFHDTEYGGRWIQVRLSGADKGKGKGKEGKGDGKSGGKGNKECEVFIGGLPFAATEQSIRKDFAQFGEIVKLRLPLNENGQVKGIAFMEFGDKEACTKAITLNDTDYGGRKLNVRMSADGGAGKDGKAKGKGKTSKSGLSAEKTAAKHGGMGVPEGKKQVFEDSDDE